METPKLQAIKAAYEDVGLPFVENVIFDNGWLKIKPTQYSSKYKDCDLLKLTTYVHSIRPKSLSGIENNRGWTRIESEEDIPDNNELYNSGLLDSEGVFHQEEKRHAPKTLKWLFQRKLISHYRKVDPVPPPIF